MNAFSRRLAFRRSLQTNALRTEPDDVCKHLKTPAMSLAAQCSIAVPAEPGKEADDSKAFQAPSGCACVPAMASQRHGTSIFDQIPSAFGSRLPR